MHRRRRSQQRRGTPNPETLMEYPLHLKTLIAALGFALAGPQTQPTTQAPATRPVLMPEAAAVAETAPPPRADGRAIYLVRFAEEGLLNYRGGIAGLAATANAQAGKFDLRTPAAAAYAAHLRTARDAHVAAMRTALGRDAEITHSYALTQNGIAVALSAADAARVAQLPGVQSVAREGYAAPATMRGPAFIGADTIWNGSATPGHVATRGEGVVIGVLDTGTSLTHPSFADDAACGFDDAHPKLVAADCTRSAGGLCTGPDPEAIPGFGHGLHTASTAAGNTLDATAMPPPALPDGTHMSGVAPCAAIRQYKVCSSMWCADSWVLAGIENAIADRVDVMNFSVSGGSDPWKDADRAFLDAVHAGIFVAGAAGNDGQALSHRGPWMTTVAATSQDRVLVPALTVSAAGAPPLEPIALVPAAKTPLSATLAGKPLKAYAPNPSACDDGGGVPAGTFTDAVAVLLFDPGDPAVQRCLFASGAANAVGAGAVAVLVAYDSFPLQLDVSGAPDVPIYSVPRTGGDTLMRFAAAHTDTRATIAAPPSAVQPDLLAPFSLIGPAPAPLGDLTKPDISAPGVLVYAALDAYSGDYGVESGTSMATPHVAGGAALLRALHADWTPMEIKSALMTTAMDDGMRHDYVTTTPTPWEADEVGSGRIDLSRAALAGLTLDETYERFVAADPAGSGADLKQLNLPALRNTACAVGGCSWTRTVTNRLPVAGSWSTSYRSRYGDAAVSVMPASFSLQPGASQTLTITAQPSATDSANFAFGALAFTETGGAAPEQHFSVAVKAPDAPLPAASCSAGACALQIDNYAGRGYLRSFGSTLRGYPFLWLNRFTPAAADYPFTLTEVQTLFRGVARTGRICAAEGDRFDVYVYRDDDTIPANGATLVAAVRDVAVSAPLGSLQTITLPDGGVRLDGPGDVLIALYWHGGAGSSPATLDTSGLARQRSWIGRVHSEATDAIFTDGFDADGLHGPDLVSEVLQPAAVASGGIDLNFIIRGRGLKADGRVLDLGEDH
jgi:subtilisin family serine protease